MMARLKMAHRQGLWASPFMPTWFGSALASYPAAAAAATYGSLMAAPRPVMPGGPGQGPHPMHLPMPPHLTPHPSSLAAPTPLHIATSSSSPRGLLAPQQWTWEIRSHPGDFSCFTSISFKYANFEHKRGRGPHTSPAYMIMTTYYLPGIVMEAVNVRIFWAYDIPIIYFKDKSSSL